MTTPTFTVTPLDYSKFTDAQKREFAEAGMTGGYGEKFYHLQAHKDGKKMHLGFFPREYGIERATKFARQQLKTAAEYGFLFHQWV